MSENAENEVRLSLPATPEFLRLARITGSGLASRLGFSYDEVEDLRLALDELCFALVGTNGRAGRLRLRYTIGETELEVEGELESEEPVSDPSLSDLASQILGALVDEHAIRHRDDGPPCVWLRKVRSESSPR